MRSSIKVLEFVHNLLSISHICSELTMARMANYPDSSYVTPARQSNSQRKDEAAAMGAEVDEVVDDYDDAVSRPPYSDWTRELWNNRKWLRKNWKKKGKKGKKDMYAEVKKAKKAEKGKKGVEKAKKAKKHTNVKKHMKGKKTKKQMRQEVMRLAA